MSYFHDRHEDGRETAFQDFIGRIPCPYTLIQGIFSYSKYWARDKVTFLCNWQLIPWDRKCESVHLGNNAFRESIVNSRDFDTLFIYWLKY